MLRPRLKTILIAFTILLTLVIIAGAGAIGFAFFHFENELTAKLESKKFLVPTEYYAAPPNFSLNSIIDIAKIENKFLLQGYRLRTYDQALLPGDFFRATREQCSSRLQIPLPEGIDFCFGWISAETNPTLAESSIQVLALNHNVISSIFRGAPFITTSEAQMEAPLLAQYVGKEPIMQKTIALGDAPTACLNAIMAIEDSNFLEHGGISLKGILRAMIKNIVSGRRAQGGSTITQQLVKNYFLSSERTLKRKAQEFIMSILLESRFTKDQILETYLNIIYMGQNGPFQVRGYGAASNFYFNKKISDLNLSECSLLAAIVNSPGLYNPFKKPVNAERRRNLVLKKMQEQSFITENQFNEADQIPLPNSPTASASETAPYFLDAVRKQLDALSLNPEGLKVYTSLNLEAQESAQEALTQHLDYLEKNNKHISKLKAQKQNLEGSVLLANNKTGLVSVVVGGRSFRSTQFNRALDGHRQVGSIMKPFVYLTALLESSSDGKPYNAISIVQDEKKQYKYQGQVCSPDNYGEKYFGAVPLFFALKNSLNAATVAVGMDVGLDKIIDVTHKVGVRSELKALPAMTLGAFEMYPDEVLQSYLTLANLGQKNKISFIRSISNSDGQLLFKHEIQPESTVDPLAVSGLVSMMKQTIISGTARSILANGFTHPAAGKTGTTSDNRDAWFAGFTPYLTAVVWVGYDSNIPHKLTGANGAVPIWTNLMKKIATSYPPDDFAWPEQARKVLFNEDQLKSMNALRADDAKDVELIFDPNKLPTSY